MEHKEYFAPKRKTRTCKISISTTQDLGAELKANANNHDISVNELINKILADAIQKEQGGK